MSNGVQTSTGLVSRGEEAKSASAGIARTSGGAKTLPAERYCSEEVFQRELEVLFGRRWLCAGHSCEIPAPGSFRRFDVGNESVILVRSAEGEIRAFFNVCRHRGTRLCWQERGTAKGALVCPYHAWSYGFDGALRAAPNMQGAEGFDPGDYGLVPVAFRLCEGLLFVNLDAEPEPFESELAPLAERLSSWRMAELCSAAQRSYEVEANWKLFFQNYSECYHCPIAHPALSRLTPFKDSENDLESGSVLGGPMKLRSGVESMTSTGQRCARPIQGATGDQLERVYYYTVFPNLFVSLHPDYVLTHRIEPLAHNRTRIHCEWLFETSAITAPDFDPDPAVAFWDETNLEDWELCRQAQLGIASRAYQPGPYGGLESQSAAFDREYLRAMARAKVR